MNKMGNYQVLVLTFVLLFGNIHSKNSWSHKDGLIYYNSGLVKMMTKSAVMSYLILGNGVGGEPDPEDNSPPDPPPPNPNPPPAANGGPPPGPDATVPGTPNQDQNDDDIVEVP